jgi:hypothetical protein
MKRFERLSRLSDYKVDKHQIDPRGWDVVNADHRAIGEVRDLIVDMETMRGVYLDIELDGKLFDLRGRDARVMVPIERADRHGDGKHLMVTGLDAARVQELCGERERHMYEFWDSFWRRNVSAEDLRRALENARPGEQVRIPAVNEEIVVERRPRVADTPACEPRPAHEEHMVARAADERPTPPTRRPLDL